MMDDEGSEIVNNDSSHQSLTCMLDSGIPMDFIYSKFPSGIKTWELSRFERKVIVLESVLMARLVLLTTTVEMNATY